MRKFINFMRAVPFHSVENGKGKCEEIWNCSNRKFSIKIWYDFYGRLQDANGRLGWDAGKVYLKLERLEPAYQLRTQLMSLMWSVWKLRLQLYAERYSTKCLLILKDQVLSSPTTRILHFHSPTSIFHWTFCMSKFNFLNYYFPLYNGKMNEKFFSFNY